MVKKRIKLKVHKVRQNSNYSFQEISHLLDVHKNTVRGWVRKGLPKIDDQRPHLIHGRELKEFLQANQKARRRQCALDEFYCFRCRAPQKAMGKLADLNRWHEKSLMLNAFCEVCESSVHKIQSTKNLTEIFQAFDISKQQEKRLSAR